LADDGVALFGGEVLGECFYVVSCYGEVGENGVDVDGGYAGFADDCDWFGALVGGEAYVAVPVVKRGWCGEEFGDFGVVVLGVLFGVGFDDICEFFCGRLCLADKCGGGCEAAYGVVLGADGR